MLSLDQAKKLNIKGPLVLFEEQKFIVFGIPADNSCQFGAFFLACTATRLAGYLSVRASWNQQASWNQRAKYQYHKRQVRIHGGD
jgi:hypothetical protein